MKKIICIQITMLTLLTSITNFCFSQSLVIQGTCNGVNVISEPINNNTGLFYASNTLLTTPCRYLAPDPTLTIETTYSLQKKQSDGSWSTLYTVYNKNFKNILAGTYRVIINYGIKYKSSSSCPNGAIVVSASGQNIGYIGVLTSTTSNEVQVGATQQNDIQFTFVDNNSNSNNLAFDSDESIVINTSGTKSGSYTDYWFAIIEQSTGNRYKSQGWTTGTIPTFIDLKAFWSSVGNFNPYGSYFVQLAASNSCNTSWVLANNTQGSNTFFICPNGSGCREIDSEKSISISPNPVSNSFKVLGINDINESKLIITDLSGKTLKTFLNVNNEDLDITDLSPGIYLTQLWSGNKRLQTSKLSIVR